MTQFKTFGLLLVVTILQISLFGNLSIRGTRLDLLLLFSIAIGMAGGPQRGASWGFAAGIVKDVFLQTPFGLSALAFCLIGFVVGMAQSNIIRQTWWVAPLTAAIASAIGVALFALVGAMVGQTQLVHARLLAVSCLVALGNAAISIPVVNATAWAMSVDGLDRGV